MFLKTSTCSINFKTQLLLKAIKKDNKYKTNSMKKDKSINIIFIMSLNMYDFIKILTAV